MSNLKKILIRKLRSIYWFFRFFFKRVIMKPLWGYMASDARMHSYVNIRITKKIFMYEDTSVMPNCRFIISPFGHSRFIMKRHSGMASGVTIIVGNHAIAPQVGCWRKYAITERNGDEDNDVILEEDVWVGANSIVLDGVKIGRGSVVGAGSVIRNSTPPYSIVIGNPAKVIGFVFTPEEIIKHEKILYPEEERLPIDLLEKNFDKYLINRIKEIKAFTKL